MRASMHRAASGRFDPTATIRAAGLAAITSLFVRPPGSVQRATLQTDSDHRRTRNGDAPLLPLFPLPCWAVSRQSSFDQGRQELQLLAGLEVTTKAVERTAEAIGADIAQYDQKEIDRALQLQLPLEIGPRVPILYILMDGTGVPVRTREVKLGCVFTQTGLDEEGYPLRDPASTTYVGAIETAERFGKRLYVEVAGDLLVLV